MMGERWMASQATQPEPIAARHAFALVAAIALAAMLIVPRLALPISFDASHSYLPMARRLLAEGFAFLHRPESLFYAPLAYVYPALLGASEPVVRWANIALYLATLLLAFLVARDAHSNRAGLLAAFLLAVSPTLRPFVPDALTEPLFIFLIAVWIAAIAAIARGRLVSGALVGGIAMGLAALTRPAVMYLPAVIAVIFAWRAWRATGEERRIDTHVALMHVVALAVWGLYALRNAADFGFPGIASGAGAALFYGVNTLVDGFDPLYYGLLYDDGALTGGLSHLTLESDRLLRGVALQELAATPLPVVLEMWARKGLAFLFLSPKEVSVGGATFLSLWRIAIVTFAGAAIAFHRRSRIVIALTALALYMLAVHLPLFYHFRYSAGAIDFPLTVLAAIGVAASVTQPRRIATLAFLAVLGGGIALMLFAEKGPGSPRLARSPHELIWAREPGALEVALRGATRTADATFDLPAGSAIEIPIVGVPRFHPWGHFVAAIDLAVTPDVRGTPCALRLRYKGLADADYAPQRVERIPIRADGAMHALTIGLAQPLGVNHEGVLRMELECASGASVELGRMAIAIPLRAIVYRDRYLKGNRL